MWSVKRDSNPRPSGPKPDALPSCAIHRDCSKIYVLERMRILRISLTDASHLMIFLLKKNHSLKTSPAQSRNVIDYTQ